MLTDDDVATLRHLATRGMGGCFAYAVAAVAGAPLPFKCGDFGRTYIACHPQSSVLGLVP